MTGSATVYRSESQAGFLLQHILEKITSGFLFHARDGGELLYVSTFPFICVITFPHREHDLGRAGPDWWTERAERCPGCAQVYATSVAKFSGPAERILGETFIATDVGEREEESPSPGGTEKGAMQSQIQCRLLSGEGGSRPSVPGMWEKFSPQGGAPAGIGTVQWYTSGVQDLSGSPGDFSPGSIRNRDPSV